MIKVEKDYDDPPEKLLRDPCKKKILEAVRKKKANEVKSIGHHYRNAKPKLIEIYNEKCAYCECKGADSVEHYRGANGVDKKDLLKGEEHPGYYWLVCEWSNLLLSCSGCNGRGAKGNRFPIQGKRVFDGNPFDDRKGKTDEEVIESFDRNGIKADSSSLQKEEPLLLNPEEYNFNPDDYLKFDSSGKIEGKDSKGRGSTTIEICKLNRDHLYTERKEIFTSLLFNIEVLIAVRPKEFKTIGTTSEVLRKASMKIFNKLKKNCSLDQKYSFYATYLFEHFEEYVLPDIEPPFRKKVLELFNDYLQTS